MAKMRELAKIIRSKNSGPFEITFDIMFPTLENYERVKSSGVLTKELICGLYGVTEADIRSFMFFDPAWAFKFTLLRSRDCEQGSINERDTFGAQQHAPLLDIEVP